MMAEGFTERDSISYFEFKPHRLLTRAATGAVGGE